MGEIFPEGSKRTKATENVASMFDAYTADQRAKVLFTAGRISIGTDDEGYVASQIHHAEMCAAADERHEIMRRIRGLKDAVDPKFHKKIDSLLAELDCRCVDGCYLCEKRRILGPDAEFILDKELIDQLKANKRTGKGK